MKYKMICIDMDGTLLDKNKKISEESKVAIKTVYKMGVEVVVATGRIYNNAAYYSHLLGVESPVIAANGAIVREKHTNKVIYESSISTEECVKLVEMLYKMKVFFHFYTADTIYCSNRLIEIVTNLYMTKQVGYDNLKIKYNIIKNIENWKKLFSENNGKITKCIAFSINPKKMLILKRKLREFDGITYYGAGKRSVEINSEGVSKGNATRVLANYYGIEREEVVCIGDNENDVSMIEYAGLGVAMGNAIPEVKKVANYITDTNERNGVAKAIKKIFNV